MGGAIAPLPSILGLLSLVLSFGMTKLGEKYKLKMAKIESQIQRIALRDVHVESY